jgi:hypothetical protein
VVLVWDVGGSGQTRPGVLPNSGPAWPVAAELVLSSAVVRACAALIRADMPRYAALCHAAVGSGGAVP